MSVLNWLSLFFSNAPLLVKRRIVGEAMGDGIAIEWCRGKDGGGHWTTANNGMLEVYVTCSALHAHTGRTQSTSDLLKSAKHEEKTHRCHQ